VIAIRSRARLLAAALAMVCVCACGHRVDVTPAPWEMRGAIVDVGADHIRVRHKSGDVVDIRLDEATAVLRDEKPVGRDRLRQGVRVRVAIEPVADGSRRAQVVRLYGGTN
jgi:hypothetical protein